MIYRAVTVSRCIAREVHGTVTATVSDDVGRNNGSGLGIRSHIGSSLILVSIMIVIITFVVIMMVMVTVLIVVMIMIMCKMWSCKKCGFFYDVAGEYFVCTLMYSTKLCKTNKDCSKRDEEKMQHGFKSLQVVKSR